MRGPWANKSEDRKAHRKKKSWKRRLGEFLVGVALLWAFAEGSGLLPSQRMGWHGVDDLRRQGHIVEIGDLNRLDPVSDEENVYPLLAPKGWRIAQLMRDPEFRTPAALPPAEARRRQKELVSRAFAELKDLENALKRPRFRPTGEVWVPVRQRNKDRGMPLISLTQIHLMRARIRSEEGDAEGALADFRTARKILDYATDFPYPTLGVGYGILTRNLALELNRAMWLHPGRAQAFRDVLREDSIMDLRGWMKLHAMDEIAFYQGLIRPEYNPMDRLISTGAYGMVLLSARDAIRATSEADNDTFFLKLSQMPRNRFFWGLLGDIGDATEDIRGNAYGITLSITSARMLDLSYRALVYWREHGELPQPEQLAPFPRDPQSGLLRYGKFQNKWHVMGSGSKPNHRWGLLLGPPDRGQ